MRYLLLGCLALAVFACGPRPSVDIHFLSLAETNQGRALPVHVVPVDAPMRAKLDAMSAEEWFVSDEADKLTGIQKRVLRGAQSEVVQMQRMNKKNDFILVVDFAEIEEADQQKIFIGDQYYRAKDVYVLVDRDRLRVVSKSVFNDYMKSY